MNQVKENLEILRDFSLQTLMQIPRGEVKEFATPLKDRKGSLKIVITDSLGIMEGVMITEKPTVPLSHYNDKPLVEMNFMLEGNIRQTHEGLLNGYEYRKGYNNILFNPYSNEENQLMSSGTHRLFSAHILPEKMASLFSGYLPELNRYAEKILKGEPFVLHCHANNISRPLKYFFDNFWLSGMSPNLGKLYFESRIMELLARQCEELMGAATKSIKISKTDLEKVYYAKEILLANLSNPPSLTGLSKLCGLNEFKLKKYFREVFGSSVFSLLCEERLIVARQLIFQGEKNITTIAYELGYAHPQHFQRAFKKYFGVTPGSLLK